MARLTDRFLKTLAVEPGQKDRLLFDEDCPGLGVRVTVKGTKTFIVQWTDKATRRKVREPLGVWGSITIDQARTATRARLGEVAKGLDPTAERKRQREAAEMARAEKALTLDALVTQWAELHLVKRRPRYAAEAVRTIRHAFKDRLASPAARLKKTDALAVLDRIAAEGKQAMAVQVMGHARACYSWAEKRGKVTENPFRDLPLGASMEERDRVLSDGEVTEVWAAAGALPYPFGPFFRLALLTLQRREEVAGASWNEFSADLSLWSIPATRMKNGRPHDVHLPPAAREILKELPRRADTDLVFSTTGRTPISGFSKAKETLDAAIVTLRGDKAKITGNAAAPLVPWRLHDFRRTGVTRLAKMGFDAIVADKLLAHKPAKLKGVASIYQRHDFASKRKRALKAWSDYVAGVVTSENVVRLKLVG